MKLIDRQNMEITGRLDRQKVNDKNGAFNGKVTSKRMEDINRGIGNNLRMKGDSE